MFKSIKFILKKREKKSHNGSVYFTEVQNKASKLY